MDPLSVVSGVGSLLVWVLQTAAGTQVAKLSDRQFRASFLDLKHRLRGLSGLPENHDVARAVRLAQLQALERVLRDFGNLPRADWSGTFHVRPDAFLKNASDYCARALGRVRAGKLDDSTDLTAALMAAIEAALAVPEHGGPAQTRAAAVEEQAENGVLDELKRALAVEDLPDGFDTYFRTGSGDEASRYLELFGLYAREQLKDNKRFHDIFTTGQLSAIKLLTLDTRSLIEQLDERFGGGLAEVQDAIEGVRDQLNDQHSVLAEVQARLMAMAGPMTWDDSLRSTAPVALAPAVPAPEIRRRRARVSNMTHLVPRHFVGRQETLEEMQQALQRYAGRIAVIAVTGMRGCGKSTLALAFASHHQRNYRVTWWLRAATAQSLEADLAALAVALEWVRPDEREEVPIPAILERLEEEGYRTLLIYDNALDAGVLKQYLPRGGAAHVLITSTAPDWGAIADRITLRLWPKDVGAQFLLVRSGVDSGREDAEKLSEACEGLPLALEIAAAYCERAGITLGEYRRRFEREGVDLIDKGDAPEAFHDRMSVTKAFQISIGDASARHAAAEPFMVHCALLAAEPIPLFLFREGGHRLGEPLASLLAGDGVDTAVTTLRMFSLIDRGEVRDERDRTVTTDVVRLHRLVRDIAAKRWTADARDAARRGVIEMLADVYPLDNLYVLTNWPRARRLDALAWPLISDDVAIPAGSELAASELMFKVASFRNASTGGYVKVRSLMERALSIRQATLGADHPDVAPILNGLALLSWAQADLTSARTLCERALSIRQAAFGPQHADVARSLINLARIVRDQQDLAAARQLCEQALSIARAVGGPDDTDVALCLSTLVRVLLAAADFHSAKPLSEEALAIYQRALDPGHPAIAACHINVAAVLQGLGNPSDAAPHLEKALAIHEQSLGPLHPTVASSLVALAMARLDRSDAAGARPLLERALEIDEHSFGPHHPKTQFVREQLARMTV